jgi:hypothetical protein
MSKRRRGPILEKKMRSEADIRKCMETFITALQMIKDRPDRIVKVTGGKVPATISNMQVMVTMDSLNSQAMLLGWVLGEGEDLGLYYEKYLELLKQV